MSKISSIKTIMMKRYMWNLALRIIIFAIVFVVYILNKHLLMELAMQPITMGITPMHLLWLLFMCTMILHLFPNQKLTMALRKLEEPEYRPVEDYSREGLLEFVKDQNSKAWIVMLVWLVFNGIFGILYVFELIGTADLIMLTVFYYLCDYICILFYCPFQHLIMKNRCCVNCRIYDWGHFMMFTPMLFIRDFFSWSLFFTACVVLIHWEIVYAKHPERFYYESNQSLQCRNCQDKICQIKKKVISVKSNEEGAGV